MSIHFFLTGVFVICVSFFGCDSPSLKGITTVQENKMDLEFRRLLKSPLAPFDEHNYEDHRSSCLKVLALDGLSLGGYVAIPIGGQFALLKLVRHYFKEPALYASILGKPGPDLLRINQTSDSGAVDFFGLIFYCEVMFPLANNLDGLMESHLKEELHVALRVYIDWRFISENGYHLAKVSD